MKSFKILLNMFPLSKIAKTMYNRNIIIRSGVTSVFLKHVINTRKRIPSAIAGTGICQKKKGGIQQNIKNAATVYFVFALLIYSNRSDCY